MADSKVITDPIPNKTCVVVGTRPGIIKMSPIIDEFESRDVPSFTIHAGQHYSYELDGKMFEDLGLKPPEHHLKGVKDAEFHGEQTAKMLTGIEQILFEEKPENVLVCGDANFNLAGALAARKLRLTLGHVEAGLRSDDWRMPEEHNRVMIDHISDYLFAPTEETKQNAVQDSVKGEIHVTGNTIVDAVERNISHAREQSAILTDLSLEESDYVVFTAHREENVDDPETLAQLVSIVEQIDEQFGWPVIYPIHPRTVKRLNQFNLRDRLEAVDSAQLIDSLGYLDFLQLLSNARIALTDSGGIQEESCILGVPCVTLRENTERPETVKVGANVIAGTEPRAVIESVIHLLDSKAEWENPFGNGNAAVRIADAVLEAA